MAFFHVQNHILKLKAPDQPQSVREESILTYDITVTCATLRVNISSKSKAINVFQNIF